MLFRPLLLAIPVLTFAAAVPVYTIKTVAGTDFVGDGGAATAAILSQPEGVAIDAAGNIYVADADDNRVRKITPDGLIQTIAGTGHAGFSGDGGPAASAQINQPYGLALDAAGNLYIADLGNARVRRVASDGGITTVAGGGAMALSSTSTGLAATDAMLGQPRNLAFDPSGNLYISDFGTNQIYVVGTAGSISIFAGSGTAGYSGDGGPATTAEFTAPAGLACDAAGDLYIADSGNNLVRMVAAANGLINTVFSIASPTGLAIGVNSTLYVAAAGYFGTTALSLGAGARDVTADSLGNLYLSSGGMVQVLSVNGTLTVIAGSGASRYYGGDGGPAAMAHLHSPSGVVLDSLGNAYIADTANNRVREILANGIMTTLAGTGVAGNSVGGGTAIMAQFNGPRGIALDSSSNVYVADTGNNRVCMITPAGVLTVIASQLSGPQAVAVDGSGNVYIADTGNNQVVQLMADATLAVVGPATLPAGLAVDASGTLFISASDQVLMIPSGGVPATVLDGLSSPEGLAVTASGDLAVAETGKQRIILIHAGAAVPIAGAGTAGFSGDGGPANAAELDAPAGVGLDGQGNICIADAGNQRIRVLAPSPTPPQVLTPVSVVNAASLASGSIAPGEIITIFGSGFDPAQTQVLFGEPATVFYTGTGQINALVPALTPGTSAAITVVVDGVTTSDEELPVVPAVPGLFLSNAATGQIAAINQDGSYNSAASPAPRLSYVSLFATGWSDATLSVAVTIGGYNAPVLYAGPAPGFAGLMQINVQVPGGFLAPGTQSVLLTVGTAASQPGATIALQ